MDTGHGDGQTVGVVPRNAIVTPSVDRLETDTECSSKIASGRFGVGAVLNRNSGRANKVLKWEADHICSGFS